MKKLINHFLDKSISVLRLGNSWFSRLIGSILEASRTISYVETVNPTQSDTFNKEIKYSDESIMKREFIAETRSGSLYHVSYMKHFFEHGGRFSCRQLVGRTVDLSKDNVQVIAFKGVGGGFGAETLDLKHFRPGVRIIMANNSQTSPIVKIFERVM
jgi:hypothetical protein